MPYKNCVESKYEYCVHIEYIKDDSEFADIVAAALRSHPAAPPRQKPPLSKALQGNLCEFCVWDVGERFWYLYKRELTWPTNANSPWRPSSDPGVDILALTSGEDEPILLVIEVKSTSSGGSGFVDGDRSSLQTDFKHLFSGDVQSRLQNRVGAVVSDLTLKLKRPDLAEKVKEAVGTAANDSQGIKLVGVLICKRGNTRSQSARLEAFQRLHTWLLDNGWKNEQIESRCIEVEDLSKWLDQVIRRAVNDHA